jgi:hypothetical protein
VSIAAATWLVRLAAAYLLAGLFFAAAFVLRGAQRVDPLAEKASWGFRVVIFPGAVAFWPLLLRRWAWGAAPPPEERSPHRRSARSPDRAGGPLGPAS